MLLKEIQAGKLYQAKVNGRHTQVRVTEVRKVEHRSFTPFGPTRPTTTRIEAINLQTGRHVTFKSAAKFSREILAQGAANV